MMLPIFPEHAIDLSLHTAILLGMIFAWMMNEWFGWVFAGFVVSGYLCALALLAPGSLMVIVIEAVLTYVIVWFLAAGLSHSGVWSRVFGRERFLLFLLVAIPIRLLITGALMPRLQDHLLAAGWTAEQLGAGLFGVGIVLVPLTANAFWKLGVTRGFVQVGTTTSLTIVAVVLLSKVTNLGFGSFAQTFDALATSPFESSRIVLVLVCTVFVAAHNNLRYGWDFGGILVPALLSMLAFTPLRFVTTVGEIAILFWVYSLFLKIPGVATLDFGGPRRIVSVYAVALFTKWGVAFGIAKLHLDLPVGDIYGFGYLLTSLVVTRCLKTGSFLKTATPIVWTSMQGIALSMPMAMALAWLGNVHHPPSLQQAQPLPGEVSLAVLSMSRDVAPDAVANSVPPDGVGPANTRRNGAPCLVATRPRMRPSPDRPLYVDCGTDGIVVVVLQPLGDPDTAWLSAWLMANSDEVSAVVMASVDPSHHATRHLHADDVVHTTLAAAQQLAGERPAVVLVSAAHGHPTLHPRRTTQTHALRSALAIPELRLDASGAPTRALSIWNDLRDHDAVLALPPNAIATEELPPDVPWEEVTRVESKAAPRDLDAFVRIVLPAIRRALNAPEQAAVPAHLVTLGHMVGGTWFQSTAPDGSHHWIFARQDDGSSATDRFLFRPAGKDWTVIASDGWKTPASLDAAADQHIALGAAATWLAARPPHTSGHHIDQQWSDESPIDQITRSLLRTTYLSEPPQVLLVEVAPKTTVGLRVGRASALGGDSVLEDMPDVAASMAHWHGARGVAAGTVEASWVPSFGLAVHYTRALRPQGLVVAWFPPRMLDELPSSPDHAARLAWYAESGLSTATWEPPPEEPERAEDPEALRLLDLNADAYTDGSLSALVRHEASARLSLHRGRIIVQLVDEDHWCSSVAGAGGEWGWPWRGCWVGEP